METRSGKQKKRVRTSPESKPSRPEVGPCDDLRVRIAERAYELYARRGSHDGRAMDDWLEAEREILSQVPPP